MKIYTKTGDMGQTGLIGGVRVNKNDIRLEAYGTVDELNSFIGFLLAEITESYNTNFLEEIQQHLFAIGSYLATDDKVAGELKQKFLPPTEIVDFIEHEIDQMDEKLPPLTNFILPGGSKSVALAHVCRTITRRAERRLFEMKTSHDVDNLIIIYFNRLSDYFFVLARHLTYLAHGKEIYRKL